MTLKSKRSFLKPCIIMLAGTVGTGKSTQVNLLREMLRNMGLNVKSTYIRLNHLLAYLLTLLMAKIVARTPIIESLSALHKYNPKLFNRLYKLWSLLFTISITVKYIASVQLPHILGHVVLIEDGPITTIVDYLHILRAFNISRGKFELSIINYLLKISRRAYDDTYIIILGAPEITLAKRWRLRGTFNRDRAYLTDPLNYIGYLRTMIPKVAKVAGIKTLLVNTDNKTPDDIATTILRWVFGCQKSP